MPPPAAMITQSNPTCPFSPHPAPVDHRRDDESHAQIKRTSASKLASFQCFLVRPRSRERSEWWLLKISSKMLRTRLASGRPTSSSCAGEANLDVADAPGRRLDSREKDGATALGSPRLRTGSPVAYGRIRATAMAPWHATTDGDSGTPLGFWSRDYGGPSRRCSAAAGPCFRSRDDSPRPDRRGRIAKRPPALGGRERDAAASVTRPQA